MFASYIDNAKVSSAIMTALTTYAIPVIRNLNGKAAADDQRELTEMYVQRIFVKRRLGIHKYYIYLSQETS